MYDFYVEVIETNTGRVEKSIGPITEQKAYKVDDGININLNHDVYHTQVVDRSNATFFTLDDELIVNRSES